MLLPARLTVFLFLLPLMALGQTAADYFEKATKAETSNDLNAAIVHYTAAINKNPQFSEALFNRGWCYISTGRYNEAARDFTKVIDISRSFPGVYAGRAYARFQLGYYSDAVADYQQEIKNPNTTDRHVCHNGLGAAYEKLLQYDKALEHYEKAIALDPTYRTAINNKNQLVQLMVKQRNKKVAKERVLSAKEYYNLGYEAGARDDYATAISYFDRAIEVDNKMKLAYDNRGWAKTMLNRHREALADLDRSLELGISPWTYNQRGLVKMNLSDTDGALRDFDQALRINPDYAAAKTNREQVLKNKQSSQSDKTAPVINTTSPIVASTNLRARGMEVVTLDREVTVTGKAIDDSGVRSVLINGIPARLSLSGEFDAKVKVSGRATDVFIVATDAKNNTSTLVLTLKQNSTNPSASQAEVPSKGLGKSYALFIATDKYNDQGWSQLNNPIADAKTLKAELSEHYGFETELLENPTRAQIIDKLRQYAQREYEPNDQLFIFVGGHGYYEDTYKEGFIVPTDGNRNQDPHDSYLPHSRIRSLINSSKCKHVFLVIDACFSGTIDPVIARRGGPRAENVSSSELIARKMRFKTRRYLTSGGKEYVSDGYAGKHSPFVRALLEALRTYGGADKILIVDEILPYLEQINPKPRYGELDDNEPGSDFIFMAR
jgi:tetratricopeptide (TPR) repeat protein